MGSNPKKLNKTPIGINAMVTHREINMVSRSVRIDIINAAKKTTQAFKAAFILFGLS